MRSRARKLRYTDECMNVQQIELELDGSMTAAASARRALSPLLEELPDDIYCDIELLVSELVANSIRHAGIVRDGWVHLRVRATAGSVRVEVRDSGPGFTVRPRVPALEDTSGRGLYLVDRLADKWGVDDGEGTCVWFELAS